MEIFWNLGLAVAGITMTVLLSGVLAGIVAFGIVDQFLRRMVQRSAVNKACWRFGRSREANLDKSLDLDDEFYSLPYRQLCGHIASRITSEQMRSRDDGSVQPRQLRLSLFLASQNRYSDNEELDSSEIVESALAFVDKMQLRLSQAVSRVAQWMSLYVVVLIFSALSIPLSYEIYIFRESASGMIRVTGFSISLMLTLIIFTILAFGSLIVANLTFAWIDRVATAR